MSVWLASPEQTWVCNGGLSSGRRGGIGDYLVSYAVQTDVQQLNGLVSADLRLKDWASGGAGLICRATRHWTFMTAYVAPNSQDRTATRLRISVMKENRFIPLCMSRAAIKLDDDFFKMSLEFFSGHIRAEVRTGSNMYDLSCVAPQLPFAGSTGLVRFYDSTVQARNFSVLGGQELQTQKLQKPKEEMFDTFICHSSGDKPVVEDLLAKLRARNVRAWVDHEQIKLGDRITEKINLGLSRSRSILVVLSKKLGQGRWVTPEYGAFLNAALSSGSMRRVIPLQIDDVGPDEIPPLLLDLRRARYSNDNEFNELVRELKS